MRAEGDRNRHDGQRAAARDAGRIDASRCGLLFQQDERENVGDGANVRGRAARRAHGSDPPALAEQLVDLIEVASLLLPEQAGVFDTKEDKLLLRHGEDDRARARRPANINAGVN
jgi:hypothetical protein